MLLRGDVEDGHARIEPHEIALDVLLEVVAIDLDGRLRLALPAFLLLGIVVGILVVQHQRQPRAVGRPRVVGHAAVDLGELHRLAAGTIEQPHLRALLLLVLVAARGEERQVLAVGAPARTRLGVGRRGDLHVRAAIPRHHPDIGVALVLLGVDRHHGVGDPSAFWRALRVVDRAHARVVVERERLGGGRLRRERDGQHGGRHEGADDRQGTAHDRDSSCAPEARKTEQRRSTLTQDGRTGTPGWLRAGSGFGWLRSRLGPPGAAPRVLAAWLACGPAPRRPCENARCRAACRLRSRSRPRAPRWRADAARRVGGHRPDPRRSHPAGRAGGCAAVPIARPVGTRAARYRRCRCHRC